MAAFVTAGDAPVIVYHFFFVLIALLKENATVKFWRVCANSPLFPILADAARTNLTLFEFLKTAVMQHPPSGLRHPRVVEFFCACFADRYRQPTVVACLTSGVAPGAPSAKSRAASLAGLAAIGRECVKTGNDAIARFFPLLRSALPHFSKPAARVACEIGLVDLIAATAVAFPTRATKCIAVLTAVSRRTIRSATARWRRRRCASRRGGGGRRPSKSSRRCSRGRTMRFRPCAVERLLEHACDDPDTEPWVAAELAVLASLPANADALAAEELHGRVIDRIAAVQHDAQGVLRDAAAARDGVVFDADVREDRASRRATPSSSRTSSPSSTSSCRRCATACRRTPACASSSRARAPRRARPPAAGARRAPAAERHRARAGVSRHGRVRADARFFTDEFIQELFPLKLARLQLAMVERIWLNWELAAKFGSASDAFFFALALARQSKPAPFDLPATFAVFAYQAIVEARGLAADHFQFKFDP
jgi:hypothetical protein